MKPERLPFRPRAGRDPHQSLIAALAPHLPAGARLLTSRSAPWASVTFVGARHEFRYVTDDRSRSAELIDRIKEVEFVLPGHFVAEVSGAITDEGLAVEALTIED